MASELDAKVAECLGYVWLYAHYKTMNVSDHWLFKHRSWLGDEESPTAKFWKVVDKDTVPATTRKGLVPKFSTDPATCEEVKAEIRRRGWNYSILYGADGFACFVAGPEFNCREFADTEYTAVCKAFIAACGREA